jgi:Tol biopolymer transport system component
MIKLTRTVGLILCTLLPCFALTSTANAAFPGENGQIAYARSFKHGLEIFSANPRTGKSERLTSTAILSGDTMAAGHPSFGPDGKRIVFTNAVQTKRIGGRRNDVYVMRADGSHIKRLTQTEAGESLPAFSADGSKVAYSLGGKTYVVNANGAGGRTELTAALPNGGIGATFSPDGTKVAVASSDGGDSDIFVMNADGTDPVNVTAASPDAEYSPDFSPDGTRLAFISDRNDSYGDLFTMAVDGSDVVSVAANDGVETSAPAYSPDGEQIAYESRENSRGAIGVFVIDADGGTPAKLPRAGAVSEEPTWGVR